MNSSSIHQILHEVVKSCDGILCFFVTGFNRVIWCTFALGIINLSTESQYSLGQTAFLYSSYRLEHDLFVRETGIHVDFTENGDTCWVLGDKRTGDTHQELFEISRLTSFSASERKFEVSPATKIFHLSNNYFISCNSENDWPSFLKERKKSLVSIEEVTEVAPKRHDAHEIDGVIIDAFWLPTRRFLVVFAVIANQPPNGLGRVLLFRVTDAPQFKLQLVLEIDNHCVVVDDGTITEICDWVFGGRTPNDTIWFFEGSRVRVLNITDSGEIDREGLGIFQPLKTGGKKFEYLKELRQFSCDTDLQAREVVYAVPCKEEKCLLVSVESLKGKFSRIKTSVLLEGEDVDEYVFPVCFLGDSRILVVTRSKIRIFDLDRENETLREADIRVGNFNTSASTILKLDRGVLITGYTRNNRVFMCLVSSD